MSCGFLVPTVIDLRSVASWIKKVEFQPVCLEVSMMEFNHEIRAGVDSSVRTCFLFVLYKTSISSITFKLRK